MAVDTNSDFAHALLIETTKYAGNFERPMCAYATGSVGECSVGDEHIEGFEKAFREKFPEAEPDWISDATHDVRDDHGCGRPASIWPSIDGKDFNYNTVAIFFWEWPEQEHLDFIIARIKEYAADNAIGIKRIVKMDRQMAITDTHTDIA